MRIRGNDQDFFKNLKTQGQVVLVDFGDLVDAKLEELLVLGVWKKVRGGEKKENLRGKEKVFGFCPPFF